MLKVGDKIPDFELLDQNGKTIRSKDLIGKTLVIYFYPKDNTPGCTKEACSLRDSYNEFSTRGILVIGISADSPKSHQSFAAKFNLPFLLLSDPEKTVIKAFGAWGEKKMYGKTYEGIVRSTFIIDGEGQVTKVFPKVSPDGHAREILEAL
ncbi:MAG: thioredoxin-dependent thiol peroxidase [Termitinemataceae bacterium]